MSKKPNILHKIVELNMKGDRVEYEYVMSVSGSRYITMIITPIDLYGAVGVLHDDNLNKYVSDIIDPQHFFDHLEDYFEEGGVFPEEFSYDWLTLVCEEHRDAAEYQDKRKEISEEPTKMDTTSFAEGDNVMKEGEVGTIVKYRPEEFPFTKGVCRVKFRDREEATLLCYLSSVPTKKSKIRK